VEIVTTDLDCSEFDERQREFFIRPEMELYAIITLANRIDALRFDEALRKHRARYSSLKAARSKGLIIDDSDRDGLDCHARVRLSDLLDFLDLEYPEYEWLRAFAKRWQKYCHASPPDIRQEGSKRVTGPLSSGISRKFKVSRPQSRVSEANHKPRYDWDSFKDEVWRLLEEEGTPDPKVDPDWTQAEIERRMLDWCSSTWGREPVVASIRSRLKTVMEAFIRQRRQT